MDAYREKLQSFDPDIAHAIAGEEHRQLDGVEMIPSENYTYPEVLAALGSMLTNKYSEGYSGRRYYGGQQYTDAVENIARDRASGSGARATERGVHPVVSLHHCNRRVCALSASVDEGLWHAEPRLGAGH